MSPPQEKQPEKHPLDRVLFLEKSNALLQRVERISLLVLVLGSLGFLLFSKGFGLSLLIGGCMGIAHFRSLHRMFQQRILHPKSKTKRQFLYGLTLFLIVGVFFWGTERAMLSTPVVIAGFFLTTGSVLIESRQKR